MQNGITLLQIMNVRRRQLKLTRYRLAQEVTRQWELYMPLKKRPSHRAVLYFLNGESGGSVQMIEVIMRVLNLDVIEIRGQYSSSWNQTIYQSNDWQKIQDALPPERVIPPNKKGGKGSPNTAEVKENTLSA